MRVLATGITGFAGHHLAADMQAHVHEVTGIVRTDIDEVPPDGVQPVRADITDADAVRGVLQRHAPDWIAHLAGISSVGESFGAPLETWRINLWGTLALLEALRAEGATTRTLAVTSGEIYGRVALDQLPVTADTAMLPLSPYGASKAAADLCCAQYHAAYGLPVIRVRAFNHIGPGQDPRFVVPDIARQIAEAELNGAPEIVIEVGNVETKRDFTDVRDMMRAYVRLMEDGVPGTAYVACTGRSLAIRDLIEGLMAHSRIPASIVTAPGRQRSGEQPDLYGDPTTLHRDTGWTPQHSLESTLADTLDWWRMRVREPGYGR